MLNRVFANSFAATGLLALAATAATATAAKSADYHVLARYALGGQDTGYDYLRLDPASRRLFVAHGNRVEVINADSGSKVGEISGTQGVHGIAFAPEFGHGFTSNGLARSVTMFDLNTLRPLAEIKYTGVKPDSIEYNPDTHQVYVVNGGETGDVSVISADTGAIVGTVVLGGGKLEAMQFDDQGHGFVNDEDKNVIHVFDTRKLVQTATWSLAPGNGPTGLAIDKQHHRLFAACGNETLVVLDSETGKVVAAPTIGADPDGAAFDPKTQRVFVSNRDGTLSVIDASAADRYTVQTAKTAEYARTIALDESNGRAYLPTAKFNPAPAPSRENPKPRPVMVPESFVVLVVGE
ncbi:MAG: PQQ-binding-like beta-propeller repeat protein [Sinobacteraceae bacterium]|nr:PQQ-binding-like beta-propeller repeat protein [Nevskiaceae bacterium]